MNDYTPIQDVLKAQFPDFTFELDVDDEKKETTLSARKGLKEGFEIDFKHNTMAADLSEWSKITTYLSMGAFGLTIVLTLMFGSSILSTFGLFVETGSKAFTLKIMYIIPLLIFLVPSFIVSTILGKKLSAPNPERLNTVKQTLEDNGYTVEMF